MCTRRDVLQIGTRTSLAGAAALVLQPIGMAYGQVPVPGGTIPSSVIATTLTASLQGTQLHLHNFGTEHNHSWHQPMASFLRLSPALGGQTVRFTGPEFLKKIARRRYMHYIKDFNSNSLAVDTANARLRMTIGFESNGQEIEGRCARKGVFKHWQHDCFIGADKGAPDGQLQRAQLQVLLSLIPFQGSFSYGPLSPADVRFEAAIQLGGLCKLGSRISNSDLRDAAFHYKSQIHKTVTAILLTELNKEKPRAAVAQVFRRVLNGRTVRGLRLERDRLVVM